MANGKRQIKTTTMFKRLIERIGGEGHLKLRGELHDFFEKYQQADEEARAIDKQKDMLKAQSDALLPGHYKWARKKRDLVKGDILRTRVGNKDHANYGDYAYAVCSGTGGGCALHGLGSAIFVDHVSFDLQEVLKKRNAKTTYDTGARWESSWGVEVLDAPVEIQEEV